MSESDARVNVFGKEINLDCKVKKYKDMRSGWSVYTVVAICALWSSMHLCFLESFFISLSHGLSRCIRKNREIRDLAQVVIKHPACHLKIGVSRACTVIPQTSLWILRVISISLILKGPVSDPCLYRISEIPCFHDLRSQEIDHSEAIYQRIDRPKQLILSHWIISFRPKQSDAGRVDYQDKASHTY